MADAPERIWAFPDGEDWSWRTGSFAADLNVPGHNDGQTEYVRADLVEQAQRAVCDATVLIAHALDDRQIDDDVVERFDRLLDDLNAAAAALRSTEASHDD